jgi:hypothetical protein
VIYGLDENTEQVADSSGKGGHEGCRGTSSLQQQTQPASIFTAAAVRDLALRQFFRTDYRGIVTLLADHSDLRRTLRLQRLPHFSTLQVASRRFEQTEIGEDYLRAP